MWRAEQKAFDMLRLLARTVMPCGGCRGLQHEERGEQWGRYDNPRKRRYGSRPRRPLCLTGRKQCGYALLPVNARRCASIAILRDMQTFKVLKVAWVELKLLYRMDMQDAIAHVCHCILIYLAVAPARVRHVSVCDLCCLQYFKLVWRSKPLCFGQTSSCCCWHKSAHPHLPLYMQCTCATHTHTHWWQAQ